MLNNMLYDEKTGKLEKYIKKEWEEKFEQLGYDIPEDRNYEMEFYKNANNIICFNTHGKVYKKAEIDLENTIYDNFTIKELIAINNLFKEYGLFEKRKKELVSHSNNISNCSNKSNNSSSIKKHKKHKTHKTYKKHKKYQTFENYEKRNYQNLQMINLEVTTRCDMKMCFEGALKEAFKLYENNQSKRLKANDFEKELATNDFHLNDAENYKVKKVTTFVWEDNDNDTNTGLDIFRVFYKDNPTDMLFDCEWVKSFSEERFETDYECIEIGFVEEPGEDNDGYIENLRRCRKEKGSVVQGKKNVQKLERCKKWFKKLGYKVEENTDTLLTLCKDNYNVIHFYKDTGEFNKTGKWNCDYDPITVDELIAINILFSAYGFFEEYKK